MMSTPSTNQSSWPWCRAQHTLSSSSRLLTRTTPLRPKTSPLARERQRLLNRKTYSMEGFDDLYPTDQPVLWFPQTIGNACGMVALVHALLNGSLRERLVPSSPLAELLDEALKLPLPTQHADLLYNSVVIENAHSKAAARGDTAAPDAQDPIGYHFMAFVKGTDGNLWGLDGSFGGMMCYGPVGEGEDMLSSKVLDIGVRRFIKAGEGSSEFSIIALSEGEE
ncbi:hypothetical protein FVEG_04401 [Fusarium verticillioides 7600]|uniref:Ubiquitin carboxyl-terminal hydrolase n=1 Tax=Gibberella moniliformis (strain M3125 / FGSC 7600) TaxID=334819 RepID=W7LVR7_GIBM7|nr:hypothetical protein FVEG_04401 [Fusarium verticillioides 7600]EWG42646.1 hypothetical protein FVEG_04401 [Fusarium verticillioides 7600]